MSLGDRTEAESTDGDSRLDKIIDEFEQRWLHGDEIPEIVEFCRGALADNLKLAEVERPSLSRIVLALALVDLEFRWRNKQVTTKRGTAWYCRNLKPYGFDESSFLPLAINELEVRSRWGDKPEIQSLVAEQFPDRPQHDLDSIASQLKEELELKLPILCSVTTEAEYRLRVELKTPCVIGRQRSSDPKCPDVRFCDRDDLLRLVIAGHSENSISRKQIRLDRISANRLVITSLSNGVPSYLGKRRLAPGKPQTFILPTYGIVISFGGFSVHLKHLS